MFMLKRVSIAVKVISIVIILFVFIIGLLLVMWSTSHLIKDDGVSAAQRIMLEGQRDKLKLGTQSMAVALGAALKGVTERQRISRSERVIPNPITPE